MKLLDEIRAQPLHVRHIFMWSLVVITFSIFGYWRISAIGHSVFASANPKSETAVAVTADDKSKSPLALIGDSLSSLRASISDLVGGKKNALMNAAAEQFTPQPPAPQKLP